MSFSTPLILRQVVLVKHQLFWKQAIPDHDPKGHICSTIRMTTGPHEELWASHSTTKGGAWPVMNLHLCNKIKQVLGERQKPRRDMKFAGHPGIVKPGKCLLSQKNRKVRRTSLNWLAQRGYVPVSRARSFAEDTYRLKDEETYTPNNVFLSLRLQRQLKPQNRNKYRCFPEILKCPGTQDLEDNKPTKKGCGS